MVVVRVRLLVGFLFLCASLAGCLGDDVAPEPALTLPFLTVGDRWVSSMTLEVGGERVLSQHTTMELVGEVGVLVDGASREAYRVEGQSVMTSGGETPGETIVAMTTWLAWEDLAPLRTRADVQGVLAGQLDEDDFAVTCGSRPLAVQVGDTWESCGVTVRYAGTETVTVPAGTFPAMRIETVGVKPAAVSWYAPEVCDVVRLLIEGGSLRAEMVLESFTCQNAGRSMDERGPGPIARDDAPPFADVGHDCLGAAGGWCTKPFQWNGAAFDGDARAPFYMDPENLRSIVCTANHEPVPCGGLITEDGLYVFNVTATDHAGHTASAGLSMGLDATAPEVAIESPRPGTLHAVGQTVPVPPSQSALVVGDVEVRASATDTTSGVAYVRILVDGAERANLTEAPFVWLWEAGGEAPGEHEIQVVAVDHAGWEASAKRSVQMVPLP